MVTTRPLDDRKLDSQRFSSVKSTKSSRSLPSTHAPSSEREQQEAEECQEFHVVDTDSEDQEFLDIDLAPKRTRSAWTPDQPFQGLDTDSEEDQFLDTDSELTPRGYSRGQVEQRGFVWQPEPDMDTGAASWQTCTEGYWDWTTASGDAQVVRSSPALAVVPPPPSSCSNSDGLLALQAMAYVVLDASDVAAAALRAPLLAASVLGSSTHVHGHDLGYGEISCPSAADDKAPFASPSSAGGPEVTTYHRLHHELQGMGKLSPDCREFVKTKFEKRLSVLTESQIRTGGTHRYLVQFTGGNISGADGVGFVFSNRLPVSKNIQLITSVFVNRAGRICMRSGKNVVGANRSVRRWEVGDHIEVRINLEEMGATFLVWPRSGRAPSVATFDFGASFAQLRAARASTVPRQSGYFAAVVQNLGVSIALRS